MSKKDFRVLLEKYLQGTLSPAEDRALRELLHDLGEETYLNTLIDEKFSGHSFREQPSPETSAIIFQRIMHAKKNDEVQDAALLNLSKKKKRWYYAAAAAMVFTVIATVFYFTRHSEENPDSPIVQSGSNIPAPVTARATLTLSDGSTVLLDSVASAGSIAQQGNTNITRLSNGALQYQSHANAPNEVAYNTLTVPRGSRVVTIILSDGTKVWLNASSSLRYPVVFTGDRRTVKAEGELYFEVAASTVRVGGRKQKLPFFVEVADRMTVNVLGTHFNIRAYADEALPAVTLVEGSVKVGNNSSSGVLAPGQQARLRTDNHFDIEKDADIEQVTAWKNGYFQFEGADIKTVMNEIARWYDVEVTYKGTPVTEHFRGNILRESDASQVFKMLEATDAVHFKIEGKRIVVTP